MPMTSRERVLTAINHEEPDRVPIILGVSNATGIQMAAYRRLKKRLGIQAEDRYLYDWSELGTAALEEETLLRLRSDVRGVLDAHPIGVQESNRSRDRRLSIRGGSGKLRSNRECGFRVSTL